jgi:hypothetical protein
MNHLKRGPSRSPSPPPDRPPEPVSDLFSTPPTAEESTLNPTRTIQYEYNHYINRIFLSNAFSNEGLVINPNDPNLSCTRDNFYLSLYSYYGSYSIQRQLGAEAMFRQCMIQQQVEGGGAVNDAIRAYSKLISKLIEDDRVDDVVQVIKFLQIDYANAMSDPRSQTLYNKTKSRILTLFGEDLILRGPQSAIVLSNPIFTELQTLLYQTFSIDQLFIRSTPMMKKIISRFLFNQAQYMVMAYNAASPLLKAHFFIFMLNNPEQHGEVTAQMLREIEVELVNPASQLNALLMSNSYPTASDVANVILRRVEKRNRPNPAAGGKKRRLRNIKSYSYSKKINKTNNKKNRRTRTRRSGQLL